MQAVTATFNGFPAARRRSIEAMKHRIVLAADEGGHVEDGADLGAAAPDHAFASERAAVAIERRHADEGCDLVAREAAEFGEGRQQGEASVTGPTPGTLWSRSAFACQSGLAVHGVLQIAVHIGEPLLEPADVHA